MRWLVILAVLGSMGVSTVEAQSLFPDRRAEIQELRMELAMNDQARLDYRRDQVVPNRLIRTGAPILALGLGALAYDALAVMLSMNGQMISRAGFLGLAAGGMALAVSGLVTMLIGRGLRRRSEQPFLAQHILLTDQLRHSRRALRGGY